MLPRAAASAAIVVPRSAATITTLVNAVDVGESSYIPAHTPEMTVPITKPQHALLQQHQTATSACPSAAAAYDMAGSHASAGLHF